MLYMAYYLNEVVFLNFTVNDFNYIYMKKMLSKREFMRRMKELENHFFEKDI